MAEDNALRLISKVIRDRDIVPVLEAGVEESWFSVEEHRVLFGFIKKHYSRYGEVPTATTVKSNFPNAKILRVEDGLDFLLDEFINWHRYVGTIATVKKAADAIEDGDHEAALAAMAAGIQAVESSASTRSNDLDLTADPLQRWQEYEDRAARGTSLLGLPSGFPTIDEATAGFQGGQLITVVATPKAGKSTLLLKMALHIHRMGYVPYFQSFEMSNREQRDRHDAMRAAVSHARLTRGRLRAEEEKRYRRMLDDMRGEHQFLLSDAAEGLTISSVQAKITKYQPGIAFIDGVYMMTDEVTGEKNTPQALTNITRSFKVLAQKTQIPIIISTQALQWKMRGGQVRADSIGYSSSFFQDSDVILGLQQADDEEDDETRRLKVVASRNCGPAEVDLDWVWETATFAEIGMAA